MASSPRVIMLEFNELCPAFLQEFMSRGEIPNFKQFHDESHVFTTDAAEDPPNLEPWIQWLTIHSGLTYEEHGAFHLGDGREVESKCVAELLSDAGTRVGILASMNTNYRELNGYFVPDPWDTRGKPSPSWISPFFDTVSSQVQESSKEEGLSKGQMIRFGNFMLRNGLSMATIRSIVSQLFDERRDPGVSWRRASLVESVQYDLAKRLNSKFGVEFATFFCNSTAHYQHYYWRNMQPEKFDLAPSNGDHSSLRDAIRYGYRQMDRVVGRFLRDYPDTTLILCTALSQQPWNTTKCTFRPRSFDTLLALAGVDGSAAKVRPVMAEQFHLDFDDEAAAEKGRAKLAALSVDGEPVMFVEREGASLFCGCQVNDARAVAARVAGGTSSAGVPFSDLFYMIHTVRSGRHHPDGVLWIRRGRHQIHPEKVRLTRIAPTILELFGVSRPAHMSDEPLPV